MLRDAARHLVVFLVIVAAVVLGAFLLDEALNANVPEKTTVTIVDENGTERAGLDVRVAASFREQYVGLSRADSLGPNEGMLFVYDRETNHSIVMRGMSFPIDVVFVGADRRITRIYHAEVEDPPLTKYRGRSKWTIEAPYNWTTRHDVSVGDRVRIGWLDDR